MKASAPLLWFGGKPEGSSPMADSGRTCREPLKRNKQSQTHIKHEGEKKPQQEPESPSSRKALIGFFSCKHHHDAGDGHGHRRRCKKAGCSGSICKLRDMQRPVETAPPPPEPCKRRASISDCTPTERSKKKPLSELNGVHASKSFSSHSSASVAASSSSSSLGGSFRGMHLRRFSGCYECHTAVDPIIGVSRDSSLRATIFSCNDCGEIFVKNESLELHQTVRHAVSELGPEDTSRNIVEIIFLSSWLKKKTPVCKIDRILKVQNSQRTITRFEDHRDVVRNKASKLAKKHPRCTADGNELLRFHCTTFMCSFGLNGATNLCNSIPQCNLCSIIRDGFKTDALGRIRTMATSGRAHDAARVAAENDRTAMLVCRVIAGRVKRNQEAMEEYDSVSGIAGAYSNLDELFVFNPKAILPCFVVIYRG